MREGTHRSGSVMGSLKGGLQTGLSSYSRKNAAEQQKFSLLWRTSLWAIMLTPDGEELTRSLEYLLKIAADADPLREGFQAQPMYIFLNMTVPIFLGVLLGGLAKIGERMLRMKKRAKK
jgi:hypothetical protein